MQNPVVVTIPVQWGEMDVLGHVNNARYFSWFESARIALFTRIGVSAAGPTNIGPILATTTCDFLKPVVFPTTLRIGVLVTSIGDTSIKMEYEVRDAAAEHILYARGSSVTVVVDYRTMQKVHVSNEMRAAIEAL